jgi:hypothetical protein
MEVALIGVHGRPSTKSQIRLLSLVLSHSKPSSVLASDVRSKCLF